MKILVGIDGSEHSKGALAEALKVTKKFSAFVCAPACPEIQTLMDKIWW